MNTQTLHVFELHNSGQTRLIAGSLDPLPPIDFSQRTGSFVFGRTALNPASKRAAPARRRLSLFGA